MNATAAICMTRMRPIRSASRPANQAPTAQPSRAIDTTNPVSNGVVWYWSAIPGTAALITDESKPNRKPPRAATDDTRMTRRFDVAGAAGAAALLMAPMVTRAPARCCRFVRTRRQRVIASHGVSARGTDRSAAG